MATKMLATRTAGSVETLKFVVDSRFSFLSGYVVLLLWMYKTGLIKTK